MQSIFPLPYFFNRVLESLLRKSEHLQSVSHLWVSAEVSTLQVYLKCSQEGLGPVYRLLLVQQSIYQELSAYYMIYTGGRDSSQVHWAIVLDPTTPQRCFYSRMVVVV